jgi:hypothetical protein
MSRVFNNKENKKIQNPFNNDELDLKTLIESVNRLEQLVSTLAKTTRGSQVIRIFA